MDALMVQCLPFLYFREIRPYFRQVFGFIIQVVGIFDRCLLWTIRVKVDFLHHFLLDFQITNTKLYLTCIWIELLRRSGGVMNILCN